jgi:signal transduction histidine kinase
VQRTVSLQEAGWSGRHPPGRRIKEVVLAAYSRSRLVGYASGVVFPVAVSYGVTWFNIPSFVFEHLIVLLVLAIAVPWGLRPAIIAAVTSVVSHNMLLQEPIGRPTITGYRDVFDLLLFAAVAIVVSGLVRRAHQAQVAAQAAADRERRAREDRDRLIATITHDLATPLSVLRGTVQFARRSAHHADADLSRLLARLDTASARATSLVRMLSDAQTLESEGFALDLATHDLRTVVEPIVEMMDRFSERHPVVLELPGDPVCVHADADRLQRVIENLVNNAIKYSPAGGAVEISVGTDGTHAIVRVRDRGIGIAPEALPHIFERSYRAPDAARRAPGMGLGLSIAAHVVARHGGVIEAAAASGGGTIVIVRLPLVTVGTINAVFARG